MAVEFAGHKLTLTIGALEEIDETNALATVAHVIANGLWKVGEVKAVLDAAYNAAGVDGDAGADMMAQGIKAAHQAAFDLLEAAFAGSAKKPAKRQAKKTASA